MTKIEFTPEGPMLRGRRDDVVFYKRKGKFYSRRFTKPRDPKTTAQQNQRARFREANAAWKALAEEDRERWRRHARDRAYGFNLFVKKFATGPRDS
jgi:hypothetical protein